MFIFVSFFVLFSVMALLGLRGLHVASFIGGGTIAVVATLRPGIVRVGFFTRIFNRFLGHTYSLTIDNYACHSIMDDHRILRPQPGLIMDADQFFSYWRALWPIRA